MRAYRPSDHPDAEVPQRVAKNRAGKRFPGRTKPRARARRNAYRTRAVLNEAQVRWARQRWRGNGGDMTQEQLAAHLGVRRQTISAAICGVTWSEIR